MRREDILRMFPERMRSRWQNVADLCDQVQEIRLRAGRPVTILLGKGERFVEDRKSVV